MKNNRLSYFVSKGNMLGIGFLLLFSKSGKNAYISILLGTLTGLLIVAFYNKFNKMKRDTLLFKFIKIVFYAYLICISLIVLTTFVNTFYLTNTPPFILILPFILLTMYLAFKEDSVLENISNLLFFFSILIVIIFGLLLYLYADISSLLPLFNFKTTSIINCAIIYASISSIPLFSVLDYDSNSKNYISNYLIASLLNFFIIFSITISLKEPLIKIYNYPEYTSLKQIKLFNFIENIENLSSFGWYLELFIILSINVKNLKKTISIKYNKIILFTLLIIISYITSIISTNYKLIRTIYEYHYITLLAFLLIFVIYYILQRIKKRNISIS